MTSDKEIAIAAYEQFKKWKNDSSTDPLVREFFTRLEAAGGDAQSCDEWLVAEVDKLPRATLSEVQRVHNLLIWHIGFAQGVTFTYIENTLKIIRRRSE